MASMAALEDIAAPTGVSTKEASEVRKEADETWKEVLRAIRELTEGNQETKRNLDRLEKTVDRVTRNIGGLNNSIGEIVEMIIIPGVKEKMNLLEHNFNIASPRKEFSDFDGSTLMEVDLLLENCNEVMAVEVKTQVSRRWVDRHLKRLELLREKEKITGMSGRTIYAAVAGINFDDDARALAVENGMYLIEIEEESERIKIIPPKTAKKW